MYTSPGNKLPAYQANSVKERPLSLMGMSIVEGEKLMLVGIPSTFTAMIHYKISGAPYHHFLLYSSVSAESTAI